LQALVAVGEAALRVGQPVFDRNGEGGSFRAFGIVS